MGNGICGEAGEQRRQVRRATIRKMLTLNRKAPQECPHLERHVSLNIVEKKKEIRKLIDHHARQ